MKKIKVQVSGNGSAQVEQLKATREWMDNTSGKHAYMCFPLSLTNGLGWGISFDRDIRAVWDGIENTDGNHVTILEGEEVTYNSRGHGTLSFKTGMLVRTDEDVTMLTMPVPNQFIRGIQTMTTLVSTSFYNGNFPLAMKFTEPNYEVFIPAGTPVATLIPLSVGSLQNDYEMEISVGEFPFEYYDEQRKYGETAQSINVNGNWSKMYRDGVSYDGTLMGKHETKAIRLKTITCPVTGATLETDN